MLRVTPTCVIRLDELEWRTTGSGGPGGQHANTSDTRVEVRFRDRDVDVARAAPTGAPARRLGPVARATASDSRSQARNRELALERLRARAGGRRSGRSAPAGDRSRRGRRSAARLDAKRRQVGTASSDRRRASDRRRRLATVCEAARDARASSQVLWFAARDRVCSLLVFDSALRTFVLPRAATPVVTRAVFIGLRWCFNLVARGGTHLRRARLGDGALRADRAARRCRWCGW